MSVAFESLLRGIAIGVGATVVLDLWGLLLKRLFGVPTRNWALVGRWVGHFPRGTLVHASIGAAAPIRHELTLGWVFHYFVGALYGVALVAIEGLAWAHAPTLLPALVVSWVMLVAPLFVMDPAMGGGIAYSRAPKPNIARLRALMNHTVYGLALYVTAVSIAALV
jgi:hypothetical protein